MSGGVGNAEIVGRRTIPELVAIYTQAVGDVKHAFAILESAEKRLSETFGDPSRYRNVSIHERNNRINWDRPDDALVELRAQIWRCIVDQSEVRRFLSIEEAERLDKALEKSEMPEISAESVRDFVDSMTRRLPELVDAAIREVFDWLRPRSGYYASRYKTNKRERVGARVVLTSVIEVDKWHHGPPYRVSHYSEKRLTALENVFRSLDGQGQRTRSHYSDLSTAIKGSPDGEGETAYFEFRAFKNGNLHLKFRRVDLLAQFNARAGAGLLQSGLE